LKIYISQGSVATHVKSGGIFSNRAIANYVQNVPVKKCETRLIFGEDNGQ